VACRRRYRVVVERRSDDFTVFSRFDRLPVRVQKLRESVFRNDVEEVALFALGRENDLFAVAVPLEESAVVEGLQLEFLRGEQLLR